MTDLAKTRWFRRPLTILFPCFMGGALAGHVLLPSRAAAPLVIFLLASAAAVALLLPRKGLRAAGACSLFFLAGSLLVNRPPADSVLRPLAEKRARVILEGTTLEAAAQRRGVFQFPLLAQKLLLGKSWISLREKVKVTVFENSGDLLPGQRLLLPITLRPLRNFQNPGGYDYRLAMDIRGFTCQGSVSDGRFVVAMGPGELPFPGHWAERIRAPARALFSRSLTPENAGLYRALILGERQGLDPGLQELFGSTGLAHVLAVSGLHVGLLAWCFFALFRLVLSRSEAVTLRVDIRKTAAFFTLFPTTLYAFTAGFHLPTQRAWIMVTAYLVSIIAGKDRDVWSTLSLAGLLVLALEPRQIFAASFQLSFAAVAGILWLTPPLMEALMRALYRVPAGDRGGRVVRYVAGLAAASGVATVVLLPILAFHFHRISLVGIPANLLVVPLLGLWVIPTGFAASLLAPLAGSCASFLLQLGSWGLGAILEIAHLLGRLSFASSWVCTPTPPEILLFYLMLFLAAALRYRRWVRYGLLVAFMVLLSYEGYLLQRFRARDFLRLTFLDVGQGSSTLVEFPGGKTMLIDGGGFHSDHFDPGRSVVAPFLWKQRIRRLDYMVLTHPQSDHMNGLRFVAQAFRPREFWYNGVAVDLPDFDQLMGILRQVGAQIRGPRSLMGTHRIGGAKVEVLYPPPSAVCSKKTKLNDSSMVLKLSLAGKGFILPGDLEKTGEKGLLDAAGPALRAQVLLAPHHGSRTAASRDLLDLVRPRICVVSCGKDNPFGFPHREVLERLKRSGCAILRTDRHGAVTVRADAQGWAIETFTSESIPEIRWDDEPQGPGALHRGTGRDRLHWSAVVRMLAVDIMG